MKKRKWIALAIAAAMMLSGCGKEQKEIIEQSQINIGNQYRYVEQKQEVAFLDEIEYLMGMSKDTKGVFHIVGMNEADGYTHYLAEQTATDYQSMPLDWLSQNAPADSVWVMDAKTDKNGGVIACAQDLEGNTFFLAEQENGVKKMNLKKCPGGFDVTKEDYLLLAYDKECVVMDWDGKEYCSFAKGSNPSMETQAFDVKGTKIVCKSKKEDGVCVYDYETKKMVNEISYPFDSNEDVVIRMDDENNVYIANQAGIHKANIMDQTFETIFDGKNGAIGLNSSYVQGMEVDQNGVVWCLIKDFDTGEKGLYQYQLSDVLTETTLDLYTMKDSEWLKKLALEFQRDYPQYAVNIQVEEDEMMTQQDKIRNLNARLLNGDGPDILMLDGMPIQAYVNHGMLEDITACVEQVDFIEGVKANTFANGKVYSVATKMGIPMIVDCEGEGKKVQSLDALERALMNCEKIFATISPNGAAELFATVYYDELFLENGQLDTRKLDMMLHCMALLKEQSVVGELDTYALEFIKQVKFNLTYMPVFSWNDSMIYDLALENQKVALLECNGIDLGMLGIANQLDKDMKPLKEMYFPYAQLGIYSGSADKEAAMKFIEFALSEKAQAIVVDDGIPVTHAGLEALTKVKDKRSSMEMVLADGTELCMEWPSEEEICRFTEVCKGVKNVQIVEQIVLTMIQTECEKYLIGEASETETRERIINQVETYLEEQK